LSSTIAWRSSSRVASTGTCIPWPALLTRTSTRSNSAAAASTMPTDLVRVTHVDGQRQRTGQLGGERVEPPGAARGQHDARALRRGQPRERRADARRRLR